MELARIALTRSGKSSHFEIGGGTRIYQHLPETGFRLCGEPCSELLLLLPRQTRVQSVEPTPCIEQLFRGGGDFFKFTWSAVSRILINKIRNVPVLPACSRIRVDAQGLSKGD